MVTTDRGPSWIGWVEFARTWCTAQYRGRALARMPPGRRGNFVDLESGELYGVSGPKRDRADTRYGPATTVVDEDAREVYDVFLSGAALPGRATG